VRACARGIRADRPRTYYPLTLSSALATSSLNRMPLERQYETAIASRRASAPAPLGGQAIADLRLRAANISTTKAPPLEETYSSVDVFAPHSTKPVQPEADHPRRNSKDRCCDSNARRSGAHARKRAAAAATPAASPTKPREHGDTSSRCRTVAICVDRVSAPTHGRRRAICRPPWAGAFQFRRS
jgi:hypothetical protein